MVGVGGGRPRLVKASGRGSLEDESEERREALPRLGEIEGCRDLPVVVGLEPGDRMYTDRRLCRGRKGRLWAIRGSLRGGS